MFLLVYCLLVATCLFFFSKIELYSNRFRNKRAYDGMPVKAWVEVLALTDYSVYLAHQTFANSTNTTLVVLEMQIHIMHILYTA
jgi:hypothetical protein